MHLTTLFKSVAVGTGAGLSLLAFVGGSLIKQEAAPRYEAGTISALEQKTVELQIAQHAALFFAGTTLIASGLRRQKKHP